MQKVNGQVQATLTELKNMIGDVLAAVDEHGAVVLTSYNKPKYRIEKVRGQIPEVSDQPETNTINSDPVSEPASYLLPAPVMADDHLDISPDLTVADESLTHPAILMPAVPAIQTVPALEHPAEMADTDIAAHSITQEEVAEITSANIVAEPIVETVVTDLFAVWKDLQPSEEWARNSEKELKWVETARDLI